MSLGGKGLPLVALALGLLACTLRPVDDSTGSGGTGGSGGSTGDGGGEDRDGECSSERDCNACRACAAAGSCSSLVEQCTSDGACTSLDECIYLCGETFDCRDSCYAQFAVAEDLYRAARACLDCDVCFDACATAVFCGG